MKRWLFFFLLFGPPSLSFALPISVFPMSLEQRYFENQSAELYFQRVNSVGASLTFDFYQFGLEAINWTTDSGTVLISYKEAYREIQSTHLFKMGSANNWFHFYSGLGIGSYELELNSQFAGTTTQTKSGQTLMMSGIASLQLMYKFLHIITDLRLLFAKDYRPEPTPALLIKVGILF